MARLIRVSVSIQTGWRVLPRKLSEMTRDELEARIAEIDATMFIPKDTTDARDLLHELGTHISEAEWFKAAIAAAWVEPPPKEPDPPWFRPTPGPPSRPSMRSSLVRTNWLPKPEPMFQGMTIPETMEGAAHLYGVLCIFTDWANWYRCAVVHCFRGEEIWQVSAKSMADWDVCGLPGSGNVVALFNTWHKAIMAGKAAPLLPGDLFVQPDMKWPHKLKKPAKKPLTAAQKRAKLAWEIAQYRPKKEPEPRTGPFTPPPLDQPLLIQHPCLTCGRPDGTHSSSCWRSR